MLNCRWNLLDIIFCSLWDNKSHMHLTGTISQCLLKCCMLLMEDDGRIAYEYKYILRPFDSTVNKKKPFSSYFTKRNGLICCPTNIHTACIILQDTCPWLHMQIDNKLIFPSKQIYRKFIDQLVSQSAYKNMCLHCISSIY